MTRLLKRLTSIAARKGFVSGRFKYQIYSTLDLLIEIVKIVVEFFVSPTAFYETKVSRYIVNIYL